MLKKYTSPEIRVIALNEAEDVIQTSGEMPIATIAGVDQPLEVYNSNDFSMYSNN